MGNFGNSDASNPEAGYAKNGKKIELFGGFPLDDKVTIVGGLRFLSFDTDIEALIEDLEQENPGNQYTSNIDDWQILYLMVGLAYQVNLTEKISFFPRCGFGPIIVKNPRIAIDNTSGESDEIGSRKSETGLGFAYEIGFGIRKDLGKHFALMPNITFSGGFVTIKNVSSSVDNAQIAGDYKPKLFSFNAGISIAYIFY